MEIKTGDIVYHKRDKNPTPELAIVVTTYPEVPRRIKLDRRLMGFISWNETELLKIGQITTASP